MSFGAWRGCSCSSPQSVEGGTACAAAAAAAVDGIPKQGCMRTCQHDLGCAARMLQAKHDTAGAGMPRTPGVILVGVVRSCKAHMARRCKDTMVYAGQGSCEAGGSRV
jgi:hypothetical protein